MIFGRRRRGSEYDDYYADERDFPRDDDRSRRVPGRMWPHLLVLLIVAAIFLGAVWLVAGRPMLEKTLQALVAPVGLVWLGLFLTFYVSVLARARGAAILSLMLWLLLSVAGNSFVSKQILAMLERDYVDQSIETMPDFDVVLLMGGGVGTSPGKHPQVSLAGDRLVQVAILFHAGKIDKIVCGGTHGLAPYPGELTQAESAYLLLTRLKVPAESILQIDGSNTLQEMQAFDRWLSGLPDRTSLKIGIVTSAWHMPRAMRLANAVGVDATPIASDFRSSPFKREPGIIVPTAENLLNTNRSLKEVLAGFFGR